MREHKVHLMEMEYSYGNLEPPEERAACNKSINGGWTEDKSKVTCKRCLHLIEIEKAYAEVSHE